MPIPTYYLKLHTIFFIRQGARCLHVGLLIAVKFWTTHLKGRFGGCEKLLNLQRKHINIDIESRMLPRIEFHYPVTIVGIDSDSRIIDFSMNVFYVETDQVARIIKKQKINLALKLPGEKTAITIKVEVVYRDGCGFGCKFWNPNPEVLQSLERCFDIYSGMLPFE